MWKRISTIVLATLTLLALFGTGARADGTIAWDTAGDSNLPCTYGAHWIILAPATDIVSATLNVGGDSFTMLRQADGSFRGDSGPVALAPTVFAAYVGSATEFDHLQLTGCMAAPVGGGTTETPAPTPPTTEPQAAGIDVDVICKHWKWKRSALRLVSFDADGTSVYRCVKP